MLISRKILKELSTPQSYLKGRNYYEQKAVLKLEQIDNGFRALVQGYHKYKVEITEQNQTVNFHCTCPYDWGGICKHCIATGLKIIEEGMDNNQNQNSDLKKKDKSQTSLSKVFKKASRKQKDDYLLNILKNDSIQKKKFFTFILGQENCETDLTIDEIIKQIKDEIDNFDLLDTFELLQSDSYFGYSDYWDSYYEGALNKIDDMFKPFLEKLDKNLEIENIITAIKYFLAIYEGIMTSNAYDIRDPDAILEGELQPEMEYRFNNEYLPRFIDSFQKVRKTSAACNRIIDIFFQRYEKYNNTTGDFQYLISFMKDILTALIQSKENAKYLKQKLRKNRLLNKSTDIVQLKINQILAEDNKWLTNAKRYYKANYEIAEKLLKYYYNKAEKKKLLHYAKEIFQIFPDRVSDFLYKNLNYEDDAKFHKQLLFYLARKKESMPIFKQIKALYGDDSANEFIQTLDKSIFYFQTLNLMNKKEVILSYLKKNLDDYNFNSIIKLIIDKFPAACFDLIQKKTNVYLEENVGRKYYILAIDRLKILRKINNKVIRTKAEQYLANLMKKYKNRPAFIDEMKKAGFKK